MTFAKLLFVLLIIALGIKRKVFVGRLLLGAGIIVPLLFGHSFMDVIRGIGGTMVSVEPWRLFAAIVIVTTLGHLFKEIGALDQLAGAAGQMAGGKRTATAVLPAVIGMMPMPAGALMSAPLIEEVLRKDNLPSEFLTAVNYWFRHVMEFFWPLYPGLILGAGICGLSIQTFSSLGIVMTVAMIFIGAIVFLRKIPREEKVRSRTVWAVGRMALSIWPLFLAVILSLVFKIDILIALLISVAATLVSHRRSLNSLWPAMKEALSPKLFFMVFGIIIFKDMLELSGAVADMPGEVARLGIPPAVVIFSATFLTGLMSGMVSLYVGLCFPVLSGFLYADQINLGNIFLTYVSGWLGIILSPTHFCLLLTSEYFKTDLGKVYRQFVPGVIVLALFGLALYLLGYPWRLISP